MMYLHLRVQDVGLQKGYSRRELRHSVRAMMGGAGWHRQDPEGAGAIGIIVTAGLAEIAAGSIAMGLGG
jgi:hypothetical protein